MQYKKTFERLKFLRNNHFRSAIHESNLNKNCSFINLQIFKQQISAFH
jgi:hypothetical protein